jgi:cysteine desulfurase/selenocysteine lyase
VPFERLALDPRREASLSTDGLHLIIQQRCHATRKQHEWLIGTLCQLGQATPEQRVLARDSEDERLAEQLHRSEAHVPDGLPQHSDVERAAANGIHLVGRVHLVQPHRDMAPTGGELADDTGQCAEGRGRGKANVQDPRLARRHPRRRFDRLSDIGQRAPGGGEESRTGRCEGNARRTGEERRADTGLELANLLAKRGLGEGQARCGTGEAQVLSDCDEVAEVSKFNVHLLHTCQLWKRALPYIGLLPLLAQSWLVAMRIHLDHARCSVLPEAARRAIVDTLERTADGSAAGLEACVDAARDALAGLIGATPEEIALTQNASHAANVVINGIAWRQADNVIVTDLCYRSIAHALLRLRDERGVAVRVVPTEGWRVSPEAVFEHIDARTRLVIVEHAPVWCGVVQPVEAIGAALAGSGALFAVNATQSAGQLPLDVRDLHCAFLFGTSRKWLRGPRGLGFLYVRRDLIPTLRPAIVGYPAARWAGADAMTITDGIERFRVADQPYALFAGFAASVSIARERGIEAIAAANAELGGYMRCLLADTDGVELYDADTGTTGTVPFNIAGLTADDAVRTLAGAGIRVSVIYAEYARWSLERLGVDSLIRASAHWLNTTHDVDCLTDAAGRLANGVTLTT